MNRQRINRSFRWLVISVSIAICFVSACRLPIALLDVHFLFLALVTLTLASRVTIRMPLVNGQITVSDTFIFLTMLLYGGDAAILLATLEGACSSLGMSRKPITFLYNSAAMACPTFLTVWVLRLCFGPLYELPQSRSFATFISAIWLMALMQYAIHSSLAAIAQALKTNESIWVVWKKYCLWSSISYFGGAFAAGLMAKLSNVVGFYALLATVPIIAIVYWTYRTYLKNIEVMAAAAKAEAEASAKAQAAAAQAEQAKHHIEELSHHIAEQERISKALQESKEHFRHAAFHDALTGLPNRALITDILKQALGRARQYSGYQFAILFLDLDRFKTVNDSLGHPLGDQLLIAIARLLEAHLRPVDIVARLGGDEFVIFLDGIAGLTDAVCLADRIHEALSFPVDVSGHEVFTTASIGIALSNDVHDPSPEEILRDADIAMYRAKENGRACHEVFADSMYARAVVLMQLENDLRHAIEREEFRIHYQAIVSLETGRISGFEALVRWQHPTRGLVPPHEFIPVAEETGLILPLGLWVLREGCRQMRQWQCQSPANRSLTISVNLSGKQFMQPDLVKCVKDVLQETDLDPRCLRLEITESVLMANAESAITMVNELKDLGLQLSIDDFGTGYSSLSYLHRFPINYLKIDRSFVNRMGTDDENLEIVRTIATLARNLGKEVIAEGVETYEQLKELKKLRCEFAQGYLFSRPVDEATAEALIMRSWELQIASEVSMSSRLTLIRPGHNTDTRQLVAV